jgi:hypothetical protein
VTETEKQMTRRAMRDARDPKTRRMLWASGVVTLLAVVAAFVAGWSLLVSSQKSANEGVTLAQQVQAACDRGEIDAAICQQADDTEKAAEDAPVGIPGAQGEPGPQGIQGEPGVDGMDGSPGPRGPRGERGEDGSDSLVPGPAGASGAPGADSTVAGPQGEKGEPGPAGTDGADGKNGRGVQSIECTSGSGTFIFHYDDGTTQEVSCAPDPIEPDQGEGSP